MGVVVDSGGATSGSDVGVLVERVDHRDDRPVLQEGQLAGTEVVQQRPERLRPHRHLVVQPPAAIGVERHCISSGCAHDQ